MLRKASDCSFFGAAVRIVWLESFKVAKDLFTDYFVEK